MPVPSVRQRHVVRAPVDGKVLASTIALNTDVGGGPDGPVLFDVGDEPRWMAEAEVGENDAPRVLPGARVRVEIAARPHTPFPGNVVRVSPVDPATHVAKVLCTVASPGVAGEVYASVRIPAREKAKLL
jgi:multidrug resistance efflux pump